MVTFFDTSVLVAALIERHPAHPAALRWLQRAHSQELDFHVGAHTLAQLYAVLTSFPASPRISPALARRLVRENVEDHATIVALSGADYRATLDDAMESGLAGGAIYDALLVKAAQKAKADRILTLNQKDFVRIWPDGAKKIVVPGNS